MITIIIADDHALVRTAVMELLKVNPEINVVGEAKNGEEAIKLARQLMPDIVLLDISMPGLSGVEVTRRLQKVSPKTQVIILSSHEESFLTSQLLKIGAAGYVTKKASAEELLAAISCVYHKQPYLSPILAEQLANTLLNEKMAPSVLNVLNPRELEIMLLICQNRNPKEMSERLFVSVKTINTYRYRLFKKLGVKNDVELLKLAKEKGLID